MAYRELVMTRVKALAGWWLPRPCSRYAISQSTSGC